MARALITGITGMDGSHLADLLLQKGYEVFGLERHKAGENRINIEHIQDNVQIIKGDLADTASLYRALEISKPDEIYNFAAQSFVGDSWNIAEHTTNITGLGVLRLLEAARIIVPNAKIVQASSSEMFGKQEVVLANECTSFNPQNPYGSAKLFGHRIVHNYRDKYGMFICSSICFNHESERRSIQFVTRKITDAVARISLGKLRTLSLGNLTPRRDWGYAPEYVWGIWLMTQQDQPDDYVLATGESHSVEEFVQEAFLAVGIEDYLKYITIDPRFMRAVEVNYLRGDYSKAETILGWKPTTKFKQVIKLMVEHDIKLRSQ